MPVHTGAVYGVPHFADASRVAGCISRLGGFCVPEAACRGAADRVGGRRPFSRSCCIRSGLVFIAAGALSASPWASRWDDVSLALMALVLWSYGDFSHHLSIALNFSDWQAWKEPYTESLWTGAHWAYRMPVFILYMAFVILTVFWPTPRNLAQVIAVQRCRCDRRSALVRRSGRRLRSLVFAAAAADDFPSEPFGTPAADHQLGNRSH